MNYKEYDYDLPKELIAQEPLPDRSASRLMVVGRGLCHEYFRDLPDHLEKGDVLVLNNSRVVNARLKGRKETGGRVELLLIQWEGTHAKSLIMGRNIRAGSNIEINGHVKAKVIEKEGPFYHLEFNRPMEEVINKHGFVPLPHYIKKPLENSQRYQTIYSRYNGSIAAPTAGLHFTNELIDNLQKNGVETAFITLHIGPSTFLPPEKNWPHIPEYYTITPENAEIIQHAVERDSLIPVGTTTVKTLESAASNGRVQPIEGKSTLFIEPGYDFKLPYKAMITNFHLPRSSLLLLVSALFGRERILNAYEEAVQMRYRFYSLGDSMFIKRFDR